MAKIAQKQSRIRGALALSLAQAIVLLLGYATHLWIGRVLGPGFYGIYGVVLSVQTIIGLFLTLGIPSAVSRFVAQDAKHAQSILHQALRWQALAALVLASSAAILAPLLARILNDASLTPYLLFVPVIVLLQAFFPIYVQFLSGLHLFSKQATLTSLYAVAKLAGALGLIYFFGVYGAFAGFAVGGVVAALVGWHWTRRLGGKLSTRLPAKSFLSFAGMYVLILVGLQVLMSLDLFMVKSLLQDNILAGYYNSAVTLARISYFLLQGLAFIILPSVSALTKRGAGGQEAAAFIKEVLRYLIALIVPGVALAAATSKPLIILFFSQAYISAAPSLTILMVGLGALAFYLLLANIVAGAGRARVGLYVTGGLVLLSYLLGLWLIPRYQLIGAALQTTITSLVGLAVLSAYTFRVWRIPLPIRSTLNIIIATIIAVTPTYFWAAQQGLLLVQYVILLALYVAALFFLGEISVADRRRVAKLHPRLRWVAYD